MRSIAPAMGAVCLAGLATPALAEATRSNIVIIRADDLGVTVLLSEDTTLRRRLLRLTLRIVTGE
jgi:hypothetical protein